MLYSNQHIKVILTSRVKLKWRSSFRATKEMQNMTDNIIYLFDSLRK